MSDSLARSKPKLHLRDYGENSFYWKIYFPSIWIAFFVFFLFGFAFCVHVACSRPLELNGFMAARGIFVHCRFTGNDWNGFEYLAFFLLFLEFHWENCGSSTAMRSGLSLKAKKLKPLFIFISLLPKRPFRSFFLMKRNCMYSSILKPKFHML